MSKKKGSKKAAKKVEPEVEEIPIKQTMEIIFESYLDLKTISLSQQKAIVSALGLANSWLYDSMIVDIITEFLRFAKSKGLSPAQTDPIYHILQNLLYKIQNAKDFDAEQSSRYFAEEIAKRIGPEIDTETNTENVAESGLSNDAEKSNDEPAASLPGDLITNEHSESIISFLQKRLFSQYTLYRTALFVQNPNSLKFAEFRKRFEVGDTVRFHDEQCLFEIDGFGDREVIIKCLKDGFKSIASGDGSDKEDEFTVKYTVSADQCHCISFVSKPKKQKSEFDDGPNENEQEIADGLDGENVNDGKGVIEGDGDENLKEEERGKEASIWRREDEKESEEESGPRTLIDELVDRKVEIRLMSMKQQFDAELREYRQQIATLQRANE